MLFGVFFLFLQFHQHFGIQSLLLPTRAVLNPTLLLAFCVLTFKAQLCDQLLATRTLTRFICLFNGFIVIGVFLEQTFGKVLVNGQKPDLLLILAHSGFELLLVKLCYFPKLIYGILFGLGDTLIRQFFELRFCEPC